MQLDAWNWEDALYKRNTGIVFYMPSLINRRPRSAEAEGQQPETDPVKEGLDKIEEVKKFSQGGAKLIHRKQTTRKQNSSLKR
jgi:hypothetical protein